MLDENNQIIHKKEDQEVSFDDRKELSSITDYLVINHSIESFQGHFENLPDSLNTAEALFPLMGINYVARWVNRYDDPDYFYFSSENTWAGEVTGFDEYLNNITLNPTSGSETIIESKNRNWVLSIDKESSILRVKETDSQKEIEIRF